MARKKRKASKKKRGRRPGIAGMSIAQLEAAVARKKAGEARKLREKRAKLARSLAALDREIAALAGRAPAAPKKRVARKARVVRKRRRSKKKVVRKKRGRRKKKAAGKRIRSTSAQIARVQASVLRALKRKKNGLLKVGLAKAVHARPQALNTALKKLIGAKKVKTKGVTRNTRYLAA